jgi:hypothetical protein
MEQKKILHIVAFNVPYPPNYGGIIDIYYKLVALNESGIDVILHIFQYERSAAQELNELCKEVHYYKRKSGIPYFFKSIPYIVITRQSKELEKNLLNDSHPVLFEGLHSTFYLDSCIRNNKKVLVRTHNIEHNYYKMLARSDRNIFRKIYLFSESRKLKAYESVLTRADQILSISTTDAAYFNDKYGNTIHVPAFHQHEDITAQAGKGDYILFHGNLSVPENEKALFYLVTNVLSKLTYRVIIAGKDPGRHIQKVCKRFQNLDLISNPSGTQMNELVSEAQINLLYTYQPTGLKLKLLHSLYGGRYVMANPLMLSGSGLDELCNIYRTPAEAIQLIDKLMQEPFPESILKQRKKLLNQYRNSFNAKRISEIV